MYKLSCFKLPGHVCPLVFCISAVRPFLTPHNIPPVVWNDVHIRKFDHSTPQTLVPITGEVVLLLPDHLDATEMSDTVILFGR